MFSQLFGRYLTEKGVITEELLERIIKEQVSARAKLGTIAVAAGMLTQNQAEEINHLQTQMDRRFGDIAVEKGYLTEEQISDLLNSQGSPYMKFIQILTQSIDISFSEIDSYLANFQKEKGFSDEEIKALKSDDIDVVVPTFAFASKPYVTDFAALVLRNITRFVTTDFYIGTIKHVDQYAYSSLVGQRIEGDHSINVAFSGKSDDDGLLILASEFAKEQFHEVNEAVFDSIGEFTNLCSGLLATELSKFNVDIDMLPPFAYQGQVSEGNTYLLPIYLHGKEVNLYISVDSPVTLGKEPFLFKTERTAGSVVTEGSKGTVLVVDDSALIRKLLRGILEEAGYTVVCEGSNGAEAVEEYERFKPDVVTLDITMPVMDGVEALKKIRQLDPSAKAFMVTAAGQQKKVIEALKLGALKFIVKPFSKEEVISSFEEAFK